MASRNSLPVNLRPNKKLGDNTKSTVLMGQRKNETMSQAKGSLNRTAIKSNQSIRRDSAAEGATSSTRSTQPKQYAQKAIKKPSANETIHAMYDSAFKKKDTSIRKKGR